MGAGNAFPPEPFHVMLSRQCKQKILKSIREQIERFETLSSLAAYTRTSFASNIEDGNIMGVVHP